MKRYKSKIPFYLIIPVLAAWYTSLICLFEYRGETSVTLWMLLSTTCFFNIMIMYTYPRTPRVSLSKNKISLKIYKKYKYDTNKCGALCLESELNYTIYKKNILLSEYNNKNYTMTLHLKNEKSIEFDTRWLREEGTKKVIKSCDFYNIVKRTLDC